MILGELAGRKLLPLGLTWADSLCGREVAWGNTQPVGALACEGTSNQLSRACFAAGTAGRCHHFERPPPPPEAVGRELLHLGRSLAACLIKTELETSASEHRPALQIDP